MQDDIYGISVQHSPDNSKSSAQDDIYGISVQHSPDNSKSSARVAGFVEHKNVQQTSGGLKPEKSRSWNVGIRLSQTERETLVQQADRSGLTLSQYIRLSLLKSPALDPERNRYLLKLNLELTRQGNNLNQIARQVNGKVIRADQAEGLIGLIARPLMQAHKAVHEALAYGRKPY